MKYRVHVYAEVRVEFEVEAKSHRAAAKQVARTCMEDFHRRFKAKDQEYAETFDADMVVDPLTDKTDPAGRLLADVEDSRTIYVNEEGGAEWQS